MSHKDELIGFRFFALSPAQLNILCELYAGVQSRPAKKRAGLAVGTFTIRQGADYDWLKSFIDVHGIPPSDYGLFVSVSTSNQSDIVRLPEFAADIFRKVGGVIDFSFTVLPEE